MLNNGKYILQKERPNQYRCTTEGMLWSDSKLKILKIGLAGWSNMPVLLGISHSWYSWFSLQWCEIWQQLIVKCTRYSIPERREQNFNPQSASLKHLFLQKAVFSVIKACQGKEQGTTGLHSFIIWFSVIVNRSYHQFEFLSPKNVLSLYSFTLKTNDKTIYKNLLLLGIKPSRTTFFCRQGLDIQLQVKNVI